MNSTMPMNQQPELPITVTFHEDGEQWTLNSIPEIAGSLEWFDSDHPSEDAYVVDRKGLRFRLVVGQLDVIVFELELRSSRVSGCAGVAA
jgi:hypothetical protein